MDNRKYLREGFAALLTSVLLIICFPLTVSASKRGDRLTGLNKYVYNSLEQFTKDVADGKRYNTEIRISLSGVIPLEYTAEDLGVDRIKNNGVISEKARIALGNKLDYDMRRIENCLLADHPYELYWFDKNETIKSNWYTNGRISLPISLGKNRKGEYIVEVDDHIDLALPVSKDYAKKTYRVNRSAGKAVRKAIAKARKIRDKYAGKTDEEKLTGYCREICKMASYNRSPGKHYGNPWQLIWVFDGNHDTKVQCEGYAKAFQYLCNISTFKDGISCNTVTGKVAQGTTKTKHMWNIVTMKNGKNYLADITNCDGDSIYYFLAGAQRGSVAKGYKFHLNNMNYRYIYDTDTLSTYSRSELSMAKSWYITSARKKAKVERIFLRGISHNIAAGKRIKLKAAVEPLYAADKSLRWKSSNKKVATVTQTGIVRIKRWAGRRSVVITAQAKDGSQKKEFWKIKVMRGSVKEVKIKGLRKRLKAGKTMKLKAHVRASKGANKKVKWHSNDKRYAVVNSTGEVTSKKAGRGKMVEITAKSTDGSNKTDRWKIYITKADGKKKESQEHK